MGIIKKAFALLAMTAALTLGAIADTWADVPQGIEAGTEAMAVSCAMDEAPEGTWVERRVYVAKPAAARNYSAAHQEEVADRYVRERYGSWSKAQQHWREHGWY